MGSGGYVSPVPSALQQVRTWPVPAAAAAVVRHDGAIDACGDTTAMFALASVTKLVTALAAHIATEEGIVALDDPVGPPGATLADLLAHASGLASDRDSVLAPPRRRRIYSNRGYELVAAHVAAAAGMPFGDYAREAVAEPLGMRATDLSAADATGARSCVDDLVRLAIELREPTLIHRSTWSAMVSPHEPSLDGVLPGFGRQEPNPWGLGPEIRGAKHPHWTGTANSAATFGHFGQSGTFVWVDPVAGVALIALTDRDFGPWAATAWPGLSDDVVGEASSGS